MGGLDTVGEDDGNAAGTAVVGRAVGAGRGIIDGSAVGAGEVVGKRCTPTPRWPGSVRALVCEGKSHAHGVVGVVRVRAKGVDSRRRVHRCALRTRTQVIIHVYDGTRFVDCRAIDTSTRQTRRYELIVHCKGRALPATAKVARPFDGEGRRDELIEAGGEVPHC